MVKHSVSGADYLGQVSGFYHFAIILSFCRVIFSNSNYPWVIGFTCILYANFTSVFALFFLCLDSIYLEKVTRCC